MVQAMVTAGQAAARTGLTRKALRVYEAKGLLAELERTAAGYRLYTADDIAEITAAIADLRIHLLLSICEDYGTCQAVRRI